VGATVAPTGVTVSVMDGFVWADGQTGIAIGGIDSDRIVDLVSRDEIARLPAVDTAVEAAVSPDGTEPAVIVRPRPSPIGHESRAIIILDLRTGELNQRLRVETTENRDNPVWQSNGVLYVGDPHDPLVVRGDAAGAQPPYAAEPVAVDDGGRIEVANGFRKIVMLSLPNPMAVYANIAQAPVPLGYVSIPRDRATMANEIADATLAEAVRSGTTPSGHFALSAVSNPNSLQPIPAGVPTIALGVAGLVLLVCIVGVMGMRNPR
jgi:hypothetical protein